MLQGTSLGAAVQYVPHADVRLHANHRGHNSQHNDSQTMRTHLVQRHELDGCVRYRQQLPRQQATPEPLQQL